MRLTANRKQKYFARLLLFLLCYASTVAAQEAYVRLNQVGFSSTAIKTAVVLSNQELPDQFTIKNANTNATVFEG